MSRQQSKRTKLMVSSLIKADCLPVVEHKKVYSETTMNRSENEPNLTNIPSLRKSKCLPIIKKDKVLST